MGCDSRVRGADRVHGVPRAGDPGVHVQHHHRDSESGRRHGRSVRRRRHDAAVRLRQPGGVHRRRRAGGLDRHVVLQAPQGAGVRQGPVVLTGGDEQVLHLQPHNPLDQRHHPDPDDHRHGAHDHDQGAHHGRLGHNEDPGQELGVDRGHGCGGRRDRHGDFRHHAVRHPPLQEDPGAHRQRQQGHQGEPGRDTRGTRVQRRVLSGGEVRGR